eukprot:6789365-Heterocapsa_arctica.AAC.1
MEIFWTGVGRHISGVRCGWENHRTRIGTKGQSKVEQRNHLDMEEHLYRMNNEAIIFTHSERGSGENQLQ